MFDRSGQVVTQLTFDRIPVQPKSNEYIYQDFFTIIFGVDFPTEILKQAGSAVTIDRFKCNAVVLSETRR